MRDFLEGLIGFLIIILVIIFFGYLFFDLVFPLFEWLLGNFKVAVGGIVTFVILLFLAIAGLL